MRQVTLTANGHFDTIKDKMVQAGFRWGGNFKEVDKVHFDMATTRPNIDNAIRTAQLGFVLRQGLPLWPW
jgi:hypothetical protein